jgi:quercetin dioxygenase-like cupin family protein
VQAIGHRPGEGEANAAFGLRRWLRLMPEDTVGAFALFEEEIPESAGPPLHVHRTGQELFTVLTGRVRFHCAGTDLEAGPGDTVLIPAGAPHAFRGLGPGPARVLVMLTPGHGAAFFRAVEAEGLRPPQDMARIAELADRHDLDFVGPPLD